MRAITFLGGIPSGSGPILTCRFREGSEPAAGAVMVFVFSTWAWDGGVEENGRHCLKQAGWFSNFNAERSEGLDFSVEDDVPEQKRRANACVTLLQWCVTGGADRAAAQEGRNRAIGSVLLIMILSARPPIAISGVRGPWRMRNGVGDGAACALGASGWVEVRFVSLEIGETGDGKEGARASPGDVQTVQPLGLPSTVRRCCCFLHTVRVPTPPYMVPSRL